jgi:SH3 domain-containing YSC84-like protein 1
VLRCLPSSQRLILMKKLLPFCLIAVLCAATPAFCTPDRKDTVTEVESCEAILQEFMSDPATAIPRPVWQSAHALIITNQFKAGYIFGIKGGYGLIMVKKPSGRWSIPVLLSANEASLGFQIGMKAVQTIYIITDDSTPRLLFKDRFNVGVDAKATGGPLAADVEADYVHTLKVPVLVYAKSQGLYAGATVKAGMVSRNDDANFVLYNTSYTLPELLYSDWVTPPPEVQPLMNYVERLAP